MGIAYSQYGTIVKSSSGKVVNPDGSVKYFGLGNTHNSHFMEITNLSLYNNDIYEFSYVQGSGLGQFGVIVNTGSQYYNNTLIGYDSNGNIPVANGGSASGGWSISNSKTGCINKVRLQYDAANNRLYAEMYNNGVLVVSDDYNVTYGSIASSTLRIFASRSQFTDRYCGTFLFLELKILDKDTNTLKYDFTPALKNEVSGLYESVNNIFYPETYNDGTISVV